MKYTGYIHCRGQLLNKMCKFDYLIGAVFTIVDQVDVLFKILYKLIL